MEKCLCCDWDAMTNYNLKGCNPFQSQKVLKNMTKEGNNHYNKFMSE